MGLKVITWMSLLLTVACAHNAVSETNYTTKGFKKTLWIVLENTNTSVALKQPFLNELTTRGALLQDMNGVTHPSQGNYIAMIAGSTLSVLGDGNTDLHESHLGDLLEARGLSWKVYAEGFPGNCFLGATNGKYARKHVPFISFTNVSTNPKRCANIVNDTQFDLDLANNTLPNFALYVPNLDNDGHDTGVSAADAFISQRFGKLLKDENFLKDTLVVVTFDESATYFGNSIYTTLIGAGIKPGSKNGQRLDHTNLLRMIEDEWLLGNLGRLDQVALPIDGVWK